MKVVISPNSKAKMIGIKIREFAIFVSSLYSICLRRINMDIGMVSGTVKSENIKNYLIKESTPRKSLTNEQSLVLKQIMG